MRATIAAADRLATRPRSSAHRSSANRTIIHNMTTATPIAAPVAPPPPLASDLCWLMARTSHALMTELTAALEQSGISPREHSVLVTAMTGSYTQTELARM